MDFEVFKSKFIANTKLRCKVDTGADGNIIPLKRLMTLCPEMFDENSQLLPDILEPSTTVLSSYGGTRITQYGRVGLKCKYKNTPFTCNFYVADCSGPVIVGLPTCRALNLVTLNCSVKSDDYIPSDMPLDQRPPINSKEHLRKMYPECFDGVDRMNRYFKITIDKTVPSVIHAPRRVPVEIKERLKQKLDDMEKNNVIVKVTEPTDWVSSLVVREKPDGSLRVCLDPTDLNKAIKRVHYPTPTVEEITPKLAGATLFSKLDAKDGYWHIKLEKDSSMLTCFNSPFGRYRFLKLPFGLKLSQDVFQLLMDEVYEGCQGAAGIADDINVFGQEDSHDYNLHEAMERTRKNGVHLNYPKCDIKQPKITFFGNIYSKDGMKPDPLKVKAIRDISTPKTKQELHTFLGMVNYLGPFIPGLSDRSAPLRELLKDDVQYTWSDSHQKVFEKLKEQISEDVTLQFYDRKKPVTLQVDASLRGVGATLLQDGRPVAYASKSLTDAETRYANIERELLAVVFGCTKFHMYLYGRQFTIESDHKPLSQISRKNLSQAPPRLQRMLMELQPYTFDLLYKPGKLVVIADCLSRLGLSPDPEFKPDLEVRIHEMVNVKPIRMTELQKDTAEDDELKELKAQITRGWPKYIKSVPTIIRAYWPVRDDIYTLDGLIMLGQRIIIPRNHRKIVLQQIHTGHLGIEKCKLRAKSAVWWPGIYPDIEQTVQACTACQVHQNSQRREPMISSDIPPRPWHTIGGDLFHFGGRWYLLLSDYYSKFPFIRQLRNQTSHAVITAMSEIFSEQGIPGKIVCDNGSQLVSNEIRAYMRKIGCEFEDLVTTSSPHYPRGHGLIERHVQTVKAVMAKCAEDASDTNLALLVLRATPLSHSLPSPAELLNTRKYKTNLPAHINPPTAHDHTYELLRRSQQSSSERYNKHSRALPELNPGQSVYVQDPSSKRWNPATVKDIASTPRSYIIEKAGGGLLRRNRIHLRPANTQVQNPMPCTIPAHPETRPNADSHKDIARTDTTEAPTTTMDSQTVPKQTANTSGYISRSGRTIKPVDKLDI